MPDMFTQVKRVLPRISVWSDRCWGPFPKRLARLMSAVCNTRGHQRQSPPPRQTQRRASPAHPARLQPAVPQAAAGPRAVGARVHDRCHAPHVRDVAAALQDRVLHGPHGAKAKAGHELAHHGNGHVRRANVDHGAHTGHQQQDGKRPQRKPPCWKTQNQQRPCRCAHAGAGGKPAIHSPLTSSTSR